MQFVKMHGLGNDFVVVDAISRAAPADPAGLARRVCDRHRGIGADGLIMMLPPSPGALAALRMRIWNADGSEAEMCGNGIRCVCKLAHDRDLCRENPMRIETGNGVLDLRWQAGQGEPVRSVSVAMGTPRFEPEPMRRWPDVPGVGAWRERAGVADDVARVSLGNPHAVFFCRDAGAVPLETVGPVLETRLVAPGRINVHFVQVIGNSEVWIRTWERGAGATLACGTGAAAVCAAGAQTGRTARRIRAHLPGGDLDLDWREQDGQVWMTGPAAEVFAGEWPD